MSFVSGTYANTGFLVGSSLEELQAQINQLPPLASIIAIYAQGTNHVCWFNSAVQIKKVKIENKVTKKVNKK
jgi:hypothetical protein